MKSERTYPPADKRNGSGSLRRDARLKTWQRSPLSRWFRQISIVSAIAIATATFRTAQAQNTAFTYQGHLSDNGAAAVGAYDFSFVLRDAATNQVGPTLTIAPVTVESGTFSVTLDFGVGVFTGPGRWLELGVRSNGSIAPYVVLLPRQQITAAPYAMHALVASNVLGSIGDTQLSTNVARLNGTQQFNGAVTFNPLFGPPFLIGSGNTNKVVSLNADLLDGVDSSAFAPSNHTHSALDVISGTLSDLRLSPNVPLLNRHQLFTGSNSFTGVLTATNGSNTVAGTFSGNGGGLTNLGAATLTGVVPDAALPGTVARLGSNQTFTGAVTFSPAAGAPFRVASSSLVTNLNADLLGGSSATSFWNIGGNAGTTGANFIGTTDNQPLELRANGGRVFRITPTATAPNIVGGSVLNSIASNTVGAVIGGGSGNSASNNYSVVAGGQNNAATNLAAVVLGGSGNTAGGQYSVAGGHNARALQDGTFVWSDSSTAAPFSSTSNNSVVLRAANGVGINTNNPQASLHVAGALQADGLRLPTLASAGALLTSDASGNATWQPATVRSQTNGNSPNIIGGAGANFVAPGVVGATIAGGGSPTASNSVSGNYGTVAGGAGNRVTGTVGAVGGGTNNVAANYATVAGGAQNSAVADNTAIGGGAGNIASNLSAVVSGGSTNTAGGTESAVVGGFANRALGSRAFVGGGSGNSAEGSRSALSGGESNRVTNTYGTIAGGSANTNSGFAATISGGLLNQARGDYSTVPGGYNNIAGGLYSYAVGQSARALHDGSFVWADASTLTPFGSTQPNQFLVRSSGGMGVGIAPQDGMLVVDGNARIDDFDLFLRGGADRNHGLGWYGINNGTNKLFAGTSLDGPVLYGYGGGALGTMFGAQAIALQWNSAQQVGIGAAPAVRLHVADAAQTMALFQSTAAGGSWMALENTGGGQRWSFISTGPANGEGASNLIFYAHSSNPSQKVIFRGDGAVGIGTMFPSNLFGVEGVGVSYGGVSGFPEVVSRFKRTGFGNSALSIDSLLNQDSILYFGENGSAVWGLRNSSTAGDLFQLRYHGAGSATYLTVNPAGNVGIGTTTPADRLTVAGGVKVDDSDLNNGTYLGGIRFGANNTGEAIASRRQAGPNQYGLDFYTGFQNRFTIANSGNVGVGTTAPAAKLDVQGSVRFGVGGTTMTRIQSGTAFVGGSSTGSAVITVPFPASFSGNPHIVLTAHGDDFPDTFVVTARAVTTLQFKVNVVRVDSPGSGWAQSLVVDWIAWE